MVRVALLSALGACGRRDRTPPDRPSQPTLTVAPDPRAPTTGRRIVAAAQIAQPWHTGAWSPASITLSEITAGDAIVVVGVYWGDLPAGAPTAPTDDRGTLRGVIDQGPAIVGRKKPPVFAQLFVELDAAPGAHTIVPPFLGGPAGDGTLYVAQIRGLTERRVIAERDTRIAGTTIAGVSIATSAGAASPTNASATSPASAGATSPVNGSASAANDTASPANTTASTASPTNGTASTARPAPTGSASAAPPRPSGDAVAVGDLVLAVAGYDNTTPRPEPGWTTPAGWTALGVQPDASNNVPSEACYRVATEAGAQTVTWTWADPTVNIAAAVIAALR